MSDDDKVALTVALIVTSVAVGLITIWEWFGFDVAMCAFAALFIVLSARQAFCAPSNNKIAATPKDGG